MSNEEQEDLTAELLATNQFLVFIVRSIATLAEKEGIPREVFFRTWDALRLLGHGETAFHHGLEFASVMISGIRAALGPTKVHNIRHRPKLPQG